MKKILLIIGLLGSVAQAQELDKEKEKAAKIATNYTWEGNKELSESNFVNAEANYRKAISQNAENSIAPYNLGNAYYQNETYSEAFGRFKQAGENATSKADKHRAYHNMGNVFMKNKEYQKAVDAYKESLRNDPTDEETRYNLALAKEMLKKEQEQQQNDQNKDDNKEQDDQKDQDQNKDQDKKEGDNKEDNKGGEDKQDENKEEGDQGDKGDEKQEENKEGEGDNEDEQDDMPNTDDQPQNQPRPNQLSPQQIKNLLEAMQNEEKKVQEKIDAQKVKGARIKNEKDW